MSWVIQLIVAQCVIGYIFVAICYGIWRLQNPGKKW
jgi:hypothetical protein